MSIVFIEDSKSFFLEGKDFSYVMRVNAEGFLHHAYYGERIPRVDLAYYKPENVYSFNCNVPGSKMKYCDVEQEYATEFLGDFREPALIPLDERGSCVAELKYDGYEILENKPAVASGIPTADGGETLVIRLKDFDTGLAVNLFYTVYEDENIITRRSEIVNGTDGSVILERALSLTLDFDDADFEMLTLYGHHAAEKFPEYTKLHHGRTSIGNVRGTTSANHAPFVALFRNGAEEENGEVYSFDLMYSGSHYESVEMDESQRIRLSMGINPESFAWKLEKGETFETPEAILNYSPAGFGLMSRQYHDFFRKYVISKRWVNTRRPVVLNSWEGMHFRFDRDRLFDTIDKLEGSGIDLFVLDDGWFGARNNDRAGLGDWYVNEEKLPGGLQPIAERCHMRGLRFGLWIEPEMVNPDSDLYRAHPDWAIAVPGRATVSSRNQYVLDLSRREVLDYLKDVIRRVIAESGADYIKWDMNRPLAENFSVALPADRMGELQHRYVLGVYELAKYLTETFPDILFEGCSGGGARFDGAMLKYFPQIWTSDDTDADERTKIQYGTTLVFPLSTSSNHVSISPNIRNGRVISMATRTNIAYGGTFGYEFDVNKLPAEEFASIPADVDKYHTIDELIREGDLYRGANRHESNEMLTVVVSKDKDRALITYYQALNPHKMSPKVKIPGLDDNKTYRLDVLGLTLPGSVLRRVGIVLPRYKTDFGSTVIIAESVE